MNRILLLVIAALGCGRNSAVRGDGDIGRVDTPVVHQDTTTATILSTTFREATQMTLPAVVFVSVEDTIPSPRHTRMPEDFRRFFGLPEPESQAPIQRGTGSGFIYDDAGHVLTNHHVVAGASRIHVRLLNGYEYEAEVVGGDSNTDVAVLRLKGDVSDVPRAVMGNSEQLQVGDWVMALGNPLGLDFTVTAGIVSAKERQLTNRATALESFIQTDAAINPGNSGGPLIDVAGRVVGMNTAIFGGPRYIGYGFAVPVDLVRRVADDLLAHGEVRRPRLGVRISDVSSVDAEVYGLDVVAGADIQSIEPDSPAERAGLELGDVVVALNGDPIDNATDLTASLARHYPGDEVALTVIRDGQRRDIRVSLGTFGSAASPSPPRASQPRPSTIEDRLGFAVQPLTASAARQLGLTTSTGVVVQSVRELSSASRAGVRSGQRVIQVNQRPIDRIGDLAQVVEEIPPDGVISLRMEDPELGPTIINYRIQ